MKIIIYTCANIAYDQIFSPVVRNPNMEYVLFSDRRPLFVSGWSWRPMPSQAAGLTPGMANRFTKFFPYKIFPDADYSIYVDANILLIGDIQPILDEFIASGADIGLFPHLQRSDIYSEFEFAKQVKKIAPEDYAIGASQMQFYRGDGLPDSHTLTENAVIFRKHRNPELEKAMELWWHQMETYTKRDQLSLPYVLYKSEIKRKIWDWTYLSDNPYFKRYIHREGLAMDIRIYLKNKRHYGAIWRVPIDGFSAMGKLVSRLRGQG